MTEGDAEFRKHYQHAVQGHAVAQAWVGDCYRLGTNGVKQNHKMSVHWLTKAAQQNNANAQNNLGRSYYEGRGVVQNDEMAVHWYTKAATQNIAHAQSNLGLCYYEGRGVLQNDETAVHWFTKAAQQNYADGQNNLGLCYYEGRGVLQNDETAVHWFTKAAQQNYADGQNNLGLCYYEGRGVLQNDERAVHWYTKAAQQNHADGQYMLGSCYYEGRGVLQNDETAVHWYTKAVEQNNAYAQYMLGVCYETGRGVKQDWAMAVHLYQKAVSQGQEVASPQLQSAKVELAKQQRRERGQRGKQLQKQKKREEQEQLKKERQQELERLVAKREQLQQLGEKLNEGEISEVNSLISAKMIVDFCNNESPILKLIENSSRAVDSSSTPNGERLKEADIMFIRTLSQSQSLLQDALNHAGERVKDKRAMKWIQSRPARWQFYLSMYERLRSLVRAGEVIASGNVEATDGFRNDLISAIQQGQSSRQRGWHIAKSFFKVDRIATVIKSVSLSIAAPGAGLVGSFLAKLLKMVAQEENPHIPFVRLSYFAAMAELQNVNSGGLEGVLERAARCILMAREQASSTGDKGHESLPWWERKCNNLAGLKVIRTHAQEDGYQTAELVVENIIHPRKGSELHSLLEGEEISPFNSQRPLYQVLVSSVLDLGHEDEVPTCDFLKTHPLSSSNGSILSGKYISARAASTTEVQELNTMLSDLREQHEKRTEEHKKQSKAQQTELMHVKTELKRLKTSLKSDSGETGSQLRAFVNPTAQLTQQARLLEANRIETAQLVEQTRQVTAALATAQDQIKKLEEKNRALEELNSSSNKPKWLPFGRVFGRKKHND